MKQAPTQVAPGIYMLEVPLLMAFAERDNTPTTLSYLVQTKSGWLMVDTGYNDDRAFDSLCNQLDSAGVPLRDIRWVFVTHYHPDHSGMANRIKEATGAKVIMHQVDWNILRNVVGSDKTWNLDGLVEWAKSLGVPPSVLQRFYDMASFGRMLFPGGLEPDIVLQGDENDIGEDGRLRAILTPGHSPGHMCLYDREERILFSGDHVLIKITPHISPSHLTSYNQLGQYLDALRKIRDVDARLVLPAHERPFSNLSERVDQILEHHRQRLDEVLVGLSEQASSPWELASVVHWDVGPWEEMDATNHVLATRETLAHLEFLESCGQVVAEKRDGVGFYRLATAAKG